MSLFMSIWPLLTLQHIDWQRHHQSCLSDTLNHLLGARGGALMAVHLSGNWAWNVLNNDCPDEYATPGDQSTVTTLNSRDRQTDRSDGRKPHFSPSFASNKWEQPTINASLGIGYEKDSIEIAPLKGCDISIPKFWESYVIKILWTVLWFDKIYTQTFTSTYWFHFFFCHCFGIDSFLFISLFFIFCNISKDQPNGQAFKKTKKRKMSPASNWSHNEPPFEFICHVKIDLGCLNYMYEHILGE